MPVAGAGYTRLSHGVIETVHDDGALTVTDELGTRWRISAAVAARDIIAVPAAARRSIAVPAGTAVATIRGLTKSLTFRLELTDGTSHLCRLADHDDDRLLCAICVAGPLRRSILRLAPDQIRRVQTPTVGVEVQPRV